MALTMMAFTLNMPSSFRLVVWLRRLLYVRCSLVMIVIVWRVVTISSMAVFLLHTLEKQ